MSEPVIEAVDLVRRFGRFTAVDRVSFRVERGEIFGLIGANGAGKTTLIRMLCGLLRPTEGTARVQGWDVRRYPERVRHQIGFMAQRFSLYETLSVRENLWFYGGVYGLTPERLRQRMETLIQAFGLQAYADRLARDLPGGFKQRLALAVALIHEPAVVFLDEPTSGVDPVLRRTFWHTIYDLARQGVTAIVTTHYLEEAEYCHRLGILHEGRLIAEGPPGALKARHGVTSIQALFLRLVGGGRGT
ncbi:putative ABC transporter ATP-binding protein YbhF [bacterium HR11]|nr:putative ABC transporter ATP-binding protein YbhF [bacterium HR11]